MTLSVTGDNIQFPDLSVQNTAATGFGFKNRIINGAMVIDQRNNGASVTPADGAYTLDRWKGFRNGGGAYTVQRSSLVPSGVFSNSAALTVTTPDTSIASTDYYSFNQEVEGFNAADFAWGTSAAMPVSLSFWLRTSVTGTWVASLLNADGSRAYPATFTITAADTWQQVTLTIPGIASGVWGTTSGSGVTLRFDLGSGSSTNGTANTWNTAGGFVGTRTSGAVNWIGTSGATFYITGVQLEKGGTATSFDYRDYGRELIMCQRYFYRYVGGGISFGLTIPAYGAGSVAGKLIDFPCTMRAAPTCNGVGTFTPLDASGNTRPAFTNVANHTSSISGMSTGAWTGSSGLTLGQATIIAMGTSTYLQADAEL